MNAVYLGEVFMRPLGKVRLYTRAKNLLVEAQEVPEIGERIFDEKMAQIGYIYDIIGPVNSPYVLVKVDESRWKPEAFIGKILYWKGTPRGARKVRKGGGGGRR
ncbi:MAG: H/ACA ribonucleoprotein complex subunit GAR1 [Infirmifilum sp.]